jgi:hypothetical protein
MPANDLYSIHFSKAELTVTLQRNPDGSIMANEPGPEEDYYLHVLADTMLEEIRAIWDCAIHVNSAFRCRQVETSVQKKGPGQKYEGKPLALSQHLLGQAADIVPIEKSKHLSIKDAYEKILHSQLPYDQLLLEQSGEVAWIHVSIAPKGRAPRRMALFSPDNGSSWITYDTNKVPNTGPLVA